MMREEWQIVSDPFGPRHGNNDEEIVERLDIIDYVVTIYAMCRQEHVQVLPRS
jgi:hypothetical protein